MKRSEIMVGKSYSNGKGRVRKVIAIGPEYKFYEAQECDDNLRYEVVSDGSKKNRTCGEQSNMTVSSFASWAKEEVV